MRFGSIPKRFLAHTYPQASGFFHDGKAAFHLMSTWDLTAGPMYSTDKQGLEDAKLGWFFFPEVQGGKGKANDIFGSVYGWLVSKDAPKEAIDFMKVCLRKEIQTKLAAMALYSDGQRDRRSHPESFLQSPCRRGGSFRLDLRGNGSASWAGHGSRL